MKKIFQHEKYFEMLNLKLMHKLLLEADHELKSVTTSPEMILDLLVVDLCANVKGR